MKKSTKKTTTKNKIIRVILALLLIAALVSTVYDMLHASAGDGAPQQTQAAGLPSLPTVPPEDAGAAEPEGNEPAPNEPTALLQEMQAEPAEDAEGTPEAPAIDEDGSYTSKDDVALYLYTYGRLPQNFITKKEAQALGWSGGSLEPYAPGCCIGGDRFGNYEGLLPEQNGRSYTECDIDTLGKKSRGAKRIVFSNDGLIYYTDDHYDSFTQLYGGE